MKINENEWKPMEIYGNHQTSMGINENRLYLWKCTTLHVFIDVITKLLGYMFSKSECELMESDENRWEPMKPNEKMI